MKLVLTKEEFRKLEDFIHKRAEFEVFEKLGHPCSNNCPGMEILKHLDGENDECICKLINDCHTYKEYCEKCKKLYDISEESKQNVNNIISIEEIAIYVRKVINIEKSKLIIDKMEKEKTANEVKIANSHIIEIE